METLTTKVKVVVRNSELKTALEREVEACFDKGKIQGILGVEDGSKSIIQFTNGQQIESTEAYAAVVQRWTA
jgi:hypothetical protein